MLKKIFMLILCISNYSTVVLAPGFVAHAYFANIWLSIHHKKYDETAVLLFFNGNLFPDIRYRAGLKRKVTHPEQVTLQEVLEEENAFKAGMKLHVFIDNYREDNFEKAGLTLIGAGEGERLLNLFLKLVEDEILFDNLDQELCIKRAQTILPGEHEVAASLNIGEKMVREWHQRVTEHLSFRSTDIIKRLANEHKEYLDSISAETVKMWNSVLSEIVKRRAVQQYVKNMIDIFTQLFSEAALAKNKLCKL